MTVERFLSSYWAYGLMFACLLPSLWISLFTLIQHLLHYTTPRLQSYVVRILVLLPIYGVLTCMLWMFPKAAEIIDMLRNLWEGLLIHSFLCLMMEYCGGESACGAAISRDPAVIRHTWPISKLKFFGLNQDIPLNVGFVRKCRLGTMQYAFVRPLLSITSIVLQPFGATNTIWFRLVYNVLVNASVYLALYILTLFYMALRKQPGLAKANVIAKFFSLKFFVVCTFYQTYAIVCFSPLAYDVGLNFGAFLVICELPIFAILQRIAYNVNEFQRVYLEKPQNSNVQTMPFSNSGRMVEIDLETNFANVDIGVASHDNDEKKNKVTLAYALGYHCEDIQLATSRCGLELVMKNAGLALDISDLFKDLYYSCSERYRRHSRLDLTEDISSMGGNDSGSFTVEGGGGGGTFGTKSRQFEKFANFDNATCFTNTLGESAGASSTLASGFSQGAAPTMTFSFPNSHEESTSTCQVHSRKNSSEVLNDKQRKGSISQVKLL